ncbi:MAG: sulfotransferase domain-containing protein [Anaerolineales bacterium]|nr:sulfotransferase domain-containing protein [Anaerolineales bacterium]
MAASLDIHTENRTTNQPPILVTGAHRSGTTWAGKMLAASNRVAYISEPLNVLHRPGVMRAPVQHWYTYICAENEHDYLPALRQTIGFRYHTLAEIESLRSIKDALRMARDWSTFLTGKISRRRALLKDPFAVFSGPWFASRLDCQVVVIIRHPAAFASSLKRLDWRFDFGDLLAQTLLMNKWLEPFREDMEAAASAPQDIIGHAGLLWRMIYQVVSQYSDSLPQVRLVRHEDLSLDPIQGFGELYASLGLPFTKQARQAILESSGSDNPKELSSRAHATRLDSQANLRNWRRRLSTEEIERLRRITASVAEQYYPAEDWD